MKASSKKNAFNLKGILNKDFLAMSLLISIWTLLVLAIITYNVYREQDSSKQLAIRVAEQNNLKNQAIWRWVFSQGGIYVNRNQRNLSASKPSGVENKISHDFILLSPAQVLQEALGQYKDDQGIDSRLVGAYSQNPIYAPDTWESKALMQLKSKNKPSYVFEFTHENDQPRLRWLQAIQMQDNCKTCHSVENIKSGQIYGALSFSLDLRPFIESERQAIFTMAIGMSVVWLIGLTGIFFSQNLLRRVYGRNKNLVFEHQKKDHTLRCLLEISDLMMGIIEVTGDDIRHLSDNDKSIKFFAIDPHLPKSALDSQMGLPSYVIKLWLKYCHLSQQKGQNQVFEYLLTLHGQDFWLRATVGFIGLGESGLPHFTYVIHDITSTKEEEMHLLHRNLLESIVSRISTELINLSFDDLEATLFEELKSLGQLVTAESAFLLLNNHESLIIAEQPLRIISWHNLSIKAAYLDHARHNEEIIHGISDYCQNHILGKDFIFLSQSHQKPLNENEVNLLINFNLSDLMVIPIYHGSKNYGFLGAYRTNIAEKLPIDTKPKRSAHFSTHDLRLFQMLSVVLGHLLDRQQVDMLLRNSESRYRHLFNNHNDSLIVYDQKTCLIEDVNPATLSLFRAKSDELIGMAIRQLSGERKSKEMDAISFCNMPVGQVITKRLRRRDGSYFSAELSAGHFSDHGTEKTIVSIRDISIRELKEKQLKKAIRQAEESERFKSAFLANMSHEIRTPMNAILGYVDILLDESLPEMAIDYLNIIKNSGGLLVKIINDILDFSRIDASMVQIENIDYDIKELFKHSLANAHILLRQKGAEVALRSNFDDNIPDLINGDPNRIQQVLNNLLSNAAKFTEHGFINIEINLIGNKKSMDQVGHFLEFVVQDSGIGIPAGKLKEMFDPFTQADITTSRRYGGTGLGLSISKKLVQLMGGEIWVRSNVGKNHGSSFHFTIPFSLAKEHKTQQPKTKKFISLPKFPVTILVAEDNAVNQKLVTRILEKFGFTVIIARDGREAIALYRQNRSINLILMDIQMPIIDGLDATRIIRDIEEIENSKKIPIIALTASALRTDVNTCLEAGCNEFLPKPIDRIKLYDTIIKYLE